MDKYKRTKDGFLDLDIKELYQFKGEYGEGCIASNRITKDGFKIGYMYREEQSEVFPDSGWRFFAGDEDEEYSNNAENHHIFRLNTMCNYDEVIIKYLDAPLNTYLIRISDDEFEIDDGTKEIYMSKRKEEEQ